MAHMKAGTALRFWNMSSTPNDIAVSFAKNPKTVQEATHVETPVAELMAIENTIKIKTKQQQMKTFLVKF